MAYVPAAVVSSFLPSRLGHISDLLGRKTPMAIGLISAAAVSMLIPRLPSIPPLVALWVMQAICYAASIPAERAMLADIVGHDVRGTGYGLYTFAAFIGAAIGPLAGGWIYDTYKPASAFYLNGAGLVLSAILVLLLLHDTKGVR